LIFKYFFKKILKKYFFIFNIAHLNDIKTLQKNNLKQKKLKNIFLKYKNKYSHTKLLNYLLSLIQHGDDKRCFILIFSN